MKHLFILIGITLLNGLNDLYLTFNQTGEWNYKIVIYGTIHFLTFASAYYFVLKYLIGNRIKELKDV